ncbi:DUF58 domain-containing protein [Bacillus sp. APMAM]|nr:DUF58 domain-containing protein [Bacillus sp. APMAM]RTZ57424.1 DUF58 domain-containing protein [Bacillus sp. SAJ1]
MIWERDFIQEKGFLLIGQFMIFFALISFLFASNPLLLFIFILGYIISLANYLYMRYVGKGLLLHNNKSLTRLKINDEDEWKFTFENKGLPILKGNVQLTFSNKVEPTDHPFQLVGSLVEVNIPFRALHREKIEIIVPIKALKRGVSTIHQVEIKIPQLFGNGVVILQNKTMLKSKKLVLPERKSVSITKKENYFLQGSQNIQSSIYFDPLQPIGTREYRNGDPFQYIHWKASARTGQLQTKVFSKIGAKTWLILLNVENRESQLNLENLISLCAYIIDYALKKNIPFALAINVKTFGESLYYNLSEGEGMQQRQKAFDILAHLSVASFTIPYHLMIQNIIQKGVTYPYIIHIGDITPSIETALSQFSKKGSSIFSVRSSSDQGVMELWR